MTPTPTPPVRRLTGSASPSQAPASKRARVFARVPTVPGRPESASVGARLRLERELLGMSLEEIARATRIPVPSLERVENDRFDDLPGEVFVRGFLRSYAKAVGLDGDEILAQYGTARRVPYVAPMPVAPGTPGREGRRVGIAIAFVLLLVLCTMALSFVLKPRGRDLPTEVSTREAPTTSHAVG